MFTHLDFGRSAITVLAIIYRVLQFQALFLEEFIPRAVEWCDMLGYPITSNVPSSMIGLDRLLAFHSDVVVHIAMFVNCTVDDQIVLLATRIIHILCYRPVFQASEISASSEKSRNLSAPTFSQSRIVALFSASDFRQRILHGFASRLGDAAESSNEDLDVEDTQLKNSPLIFQGGLNSEMPGYANCVRNSILDLLIGPERSNTNDMAPQFSHFLLGYDCGKLLSQSDISQDRSRPSCLVEIIRLLSVGTSATGRVHHGADQDGYDDCTEWEPLNVKYPSLSEKCYHLLYKLCVSSATRGPTLRLLRTGDFLYSQIENLSLSSTLHQEAFERLKCLPDEQRDSAFAKLSSDFFRLSWIMRLAALDLFSTITANQRSYAQKLMRILFCCKGQILSDFGSGKIREYEQPFSLVLELLYCFDLTGTRLEVDKQSFEKYPMSSFVNRSDTGTEMYDIRAIHLFLKQKEVEVSSPHLRVAFDREMERILYHSLRFNEMQELKAAQRECFKSWSSIVMFAMSNDGLRYLPSENREDMAYDLLAALLRLLNSQDTQLHNCISISTTVLALVARINADRSYQNLLQNPSPRNDKGENSFSSRLPWDSLQKIVLKGIIDGILRSGSTVFMRGCLYNALLEYLRFTFPDDYESNTQLSSYRMSLISENASVISGYGSTLFEVICRDACDAASVWKAVAFNTLSGIYELFDRAYSSEKNPLLSFIYEKSFLRSFIFILSDSVPMLEASLEHLSGNSAFLICCFRSAAFTSCLFI